MPDKISLLPDTVANQIAAGEVVQRPSSVIKELLENAVDAGASRIVLRIKEGGSVLIQTIDNGCGMSHTDARMCWERHATSKIKKAEDLFALRSFGFRGEALASIASVAMVEMDTKMKENDTGTRIVIEGGNIKKHEFVAGVNGTKISVKNLFYNIPARRSFLKSITVETKHAMDEFNRSALAHPEIAFELYNNDKLVMDLPATDPKNRAVMVWGRIKHTDLLDVNEETDIVQIKGFVGKPETAKKQRGDQYLFVNHRFIRDPYLNHAIRSAFQQLIPADAHPGYVLYLQIEPSRIDVNVHPSKTEIKFEDERFLYSILHAAIKKAVGAFVQVPDLNADIAFLPDFKTPVSPPPTPSSFNPEPKLNPRYTPFDTPAYSKPKNTLGWENLYNPTKEERTTPKQEQVSLFSKPFQGTKVCDAVFGFEDLLVAKAYGELYLIQVFLARERIWYERYLKQMQKHNAATQQLLFPKTLVFSPSDAELLSSVLEEIKAMGFDIGEFGNNTFIVNGLPSTLPKGNEQEILSSLLENYKENREKFNLNGAENLARSMAQKAAQMGTPLVNTAEQEALVAELFSCDFPKYCPFGRPIYAPLSRPEIAKLFKI